MVRLSEDVELSVVDGCAVFSHAGGDLTILNETASCIIAGIMEGASRSSVAMELSSRYGIKAEEAYSDVDDVLSELIMCNVVVRA